MAKWRPGPLEDIVTFNLLDSNSDLDKFRNMLRVI